MLLLDSQGRSPHPSKNRYSINILIVGRKYERNIQLISQCYPGSAFCRDCIYSIAFMANSAYSPFSTNQRLAITWSCLKVPCVLCFRVSFNKLTLFNLNFAQLIYQQLTDGLQSSWTHKRVLNQNMQMNRLVAWQVRSGNHYTVIHI